MCASKSRDHSIFSKFWSNALLLTNEENFREWNDWKTNKLKSTIKTLHKKFRILSISAPPFVYGDPKRRRRWSEPDRNRGDSESDGTQVKRLSQPLHNQPICKCVYIYKGFFNFIFCTKFHFGIDFKIWDNVYRFTFLSYYFIIWWKRPIF